MAILIQDALTNQFYAVRCSSNSKGYITSADDEGIPRDFDFPFWTDNQSEAFDFKSERMARHELECCNDLTEDGNRDPLIIII